MEISYLESLPYLVFVQVSSKLKGSDLINFCQSSPLINEKCNRDFVSESGNVVRQYVFTKILEQIGIPVRGNPREQYVNLIRHRAYFSIKQKFDLHLRVWEIDKRIKTIFDLLYNPPSNFDDVLIFNIGRRLRDQSNRQLLNDIYFLMIDTEVLSEKLNLEHGNDEEETLIRLYQNMKEKYDRLRHLLQGNEKLYSYMDFENLKLYVKPQSFSNFNHLFAKILAKAIRDTGYNMMDARMDFNHEFFNDDHIQFFMEGESEFNETIKYIVENRNELERFSEDELDYLCYLHYKVINEEIPVLESFDYFKLIGYD